jgi:hypothetical protein
MVMIIVSLETSLGCDFSLKSPVCRQLLQPRRSDFFNAWPMLDGNLNVYGAPKGAELICREGRPSRNG